MIFRGWKLLDLRVNKEKSPSKVLLIYLPSFITSPSQKEISLGLLFSWCPSLFCCLFLICSLSKKGQEDQGWLFCLQDPLKYCKNLFTARYYPICYQELVLNRFKQKFKLNKEFEITWLNSLSLQWEAAQIRIHCALFCHDFMLSLFFSYPAKRE